jgi:predicted PurR-regulated permease PerM
MEGTNWTLVVSIISLAFVILSTVLGFVWKQLSDLREKVYQIEIWARDEFVRKGSFEIVINRMEKSIEKIGDKIDAKFDDLTKRINARD